MFFSLSVYLTSSQTMQQWPTHDQQITVVDNWKNYFCNTFSVLQKQKYSRIELCSALESELKITTQSISQAWNMDDLTCNVAQTCEANQLCHWLTELFTTEWINDPTKMVVDRWIHALFLATGIQHIPVVRDCNSQECRFGSHTFKSWDR